MTDDDDIRNLIERSSLGTPGAQRLRRRTPEAQLDIVRQVAAGRRPMMSGGFDAPLEAGRVMVREWDPRTAPSAEIESMLHALNAMLAVDLPDDPPWRTDSFREYLTVTMPGEQRINWVAEDTPGAAAEGGPRGSTCSEPRTSCCSTRAVLEVLVHPEARRMGVGRSCCAPRWPGPIRGLRHAGR